MDKRYFTVDEANHFLPQLQHSLLRLQEMKQDLQIKYHQLQEAKATVDQAAPNDLFFQEEAELEFLMFSANSLLGQIQQRGVQVKDIDTGLCDFPALMHGQDVLLCWRLGEQQVAHWHGLYEGYLGRKEIWDETDFLLD